MASSFIKAIKKDEGGLQSRVIPHSNQKSNNIVKSSIRGILNSTPFKFHKSSSESKLAIKENLFQLSARKNICNDKYLSPSKEKNIITHLISEFDSPGTKDVKTEIKLHSQMHTAPKRSLSPNNFMTTQKRNLKYVNKGSIIKYETIKLSDYHGKQLCFKKYDEKDIGILDKWSKFLHETVQPFQNPLLLCINNKFRKQMMIALQLHPSSEEQIEFATSNQLIK